jgi:hypothetical protein
MIADYKIYETCKQKQKAWKYKHASYPTNNHTPQHIFPKQCLYSRASYITYINLAQNNLVYVQDSGRFEMCTSELVNDVA